MRVWANKSLAQGMRWLTRTATPPLGCRVSLMPRSRCLSPPGDNVGQNISGLDKQSPGSEDEEPGETAKVGAFTQKDIDVLERALEEEPGGLAAEGIRQALRKLQGLGKAGDAGSSIAGPGR